MHYLDSLYLELDGYHGDADDTCRVQTITYICNYLGNSTIENFNHSFFHDMLNINILSQHNCGGYDRCICMTPSGNVCPMQGEYIQSGCTHKLFSIGYNLISSTLSHYRDYYTLREYIPTCTKQIDHIANSYIVTMVQFSIPVIRTTVQDVDLAYAK